MKVCSKSLLALGAAVGLSLATNQADAQAATPGSKSTDYITRDASGNVVARDDAAGFGQKRQWAFSSDASIQVSRTTQSESDGANTQLSLAPAADYFIIKNLSLGGSVGVFYQKSGENSGSRFTIGPRVGYNFELSRMLSVWPKLGFNYAYTGNDYNGARVVNGDPVVNSGDNNAVALSLFAPIMLHPAPHFFAGLGPFLDTDLSGDNRATSWGIKLTMGGWIMPKGA